MEKNNPDYDPGPEEQGGFYEGVDQAVRALRLQNVFLFFSKPVPGAAIAALKKKLLHAGVAEDAEEWAGSVLFLALETAAIAFLFSWIILRITELEFLSAAALAAGIAIPLAAYSFLFIQMEDRKNRLEAALPQALRMIAANMRAGMTPMVALRTSARPEFGPLSDEIKLATSKALGTESFEAVLNSMGAKFDSDIFSRIVALFSASLRSGGNLAQLLENAAEDLRTNQELKIELETSTRMYVLFILFVVVIATPLLFSVSIQFTSTISRLLAEQQSEAFVSAETGGALIRVPFSREFLLQTSIATLAATALLASFLMGVIREGKWMSGAKYAPFIVTASLASFYFLQQYALASFFQP